MNRKPITRKEYNRLCRQVKDALELASNHDPDHELRLAIIERQLQRLGAPQYRTIRKGKEDSAVTMAQKIREENAAKINKAREQQKAIQAACTHRHAPGNLPISGLDMPKGNPHTVIVHDGRAGDYLLCQKNQCIIKPGDDLELYNDTLAFQAAFNEMLSKPEAPAPAPKHPLAFALRVFLTRLGFGEDANGHDNA
jgi:hypothetical protein